MLLYENQSVSTDWFCCSRIKSLTYYRLRTPVKHCEWFLRGGYSQFSKSLPLIKCDRTFAQRQGNRVSIKIPDGMIRLKDLKNRHLGNMIPLQRKGIIIKLRASVAIISYSNSNEHFNVWFSLLLPISIKSVAFRGTPLKSVSARCDHLRGSQHADPAREYYSAFLKFANKSLSHQRWGFWRSSCRVDRSKSSLVSS